MSQTVSTDVLMARFDSICSRIGQDLPPKDAPADLATAKSQLVSARKDIDEDPEDVMHMTVRGLKVVEVYALQAGLCSCDDWNQILVHRDFKANRFNNVKFVGKVVLGEFKGNVTLPSGISLPSGVYHTTLVNCQIGNDCLIDHAGIVANVICEPQSVLFHVGRVTCGPKATFGCGIELPVGCEVGGREVPVWAEMRADDAAWIATHRNCKEGLAKVQAAVKQYVTSIESPYGWVKRGAQILHATAVDNCFIGEGAVLDHPHELRNVCVLSSAEEPTKICDGAHVTDSVVQWGSHIQGNGIVRTSVLLEHSGVEENGIVVDSILCPNTHVARGEATASFLGPFVGFHHQSLMVSTFWAGGKGNVSYGAMLGSNHTGRAPDQELWPGEGMFFGLGCSIRFPSDFTGAPYSMISAGTKTLPQKLVMPFSMITTPEADPEPNPNDAKMKLNGLNELFPAWSLIRNAYGVERMAVKFAKRDHARRNVIPQAVLRPEIMDLVLIALTNLEKLSAPYRPVYYPGDIAGMGKNFVRGASVQKAIEAYRNVLKRYAFGVLLLEAEAKKQSSTTAETTPSSSSSLSSDLLAHACRVADLVSPNQPLASRLAELVALETDYAVQVGSCKAQDDVRGQSIIPGYQDAHVASADDPVVIGAKARASKLQERVAAL